jgi:hypothetical protein
MLIHTTSSIFASFPYLAVVREIRYRLVAILNKKSRKLLKGRLSQAGQMYRRAKEGAAKVTPRISSIRGWGLYAPAPLFLSSQFPRILLTGIPVSENLEYRKASVREHPFLAFH